MGEKLIETIDTLSRMEKQQTFLLKLSDALRPLGNPVDIEEVATKIAMDFMDADRCYYSTIDGDNVIILHDAVRENLPSIAGVHTINGFALYKSVLSAGHPFVVDDVLTSNILDEDLKKVCLQYQYGSFINIPVIKNGKPVGLFSLVQRQPRKWTDIELQLTIETAERTWAAVERAKAEDALRKSEEKYRTLFDSIDEGFSILEVLFDDKQKAVDYTFREMNNAHKAMTGMSQTAVGMRISELMPKLEESVLERLEKVVLTGEPIRYEQYESAWNRWFDVHSSRVGGDGSRLVANVFNNITDRKQAEEKLKESEERFRSMADASPVMIWTLDAGGNSTYYNKTATDFTGHTEQALKDGKSWQTAIHPDDIALAGSVVSNAVQKRQPYQMECRMRRGDGDWRWLLSHGTPRLGKNNELLGYVGSSVDITELKKSQQELQTALEQVRLSKEAAELGTFDMDLEKGTMHWDDRCRTLFGISHRNTVTYEKDFVEGLHPEDRDRIIKIIDRLFIKSISNGDYDVEYRTVGVEDGLVRWVRAKGKVYFNEQEKPIRFIGSVLDITEKVTALQKIEGLVEERTTELAQANNTLQTINKELERSNQNLEEFAQALKESNLLLQQTNEQLEQFAYVTSHDLQEPLRKIRFYTNYVLNSSELAEANKKYLEKINASAQRMSGLIQSLLEYSQILQKLHHFAPVNLNATVVEVLSDFELLIQQKQADIRIEELPIIEAIALQMNQLFFNLIGNALKFTRRNVNPIIHINSSKFSHERKKDFSDLDQAKEYVEIQITDNGIGFNKEYADQIFTIFQRLNESSTYGGYGIGLALCKKIIANHSGSIYAKSKAGEGASFIFVLPYTQT